jgi:hypothetical protein
MVYYERVPLRRSARRYQEGGEVDPYDPLAASAGVSPTGTPRIDQIDWGRPSWTQQASEQSQRDDEAYAKEGVQGVLRDTEGTQDLAGGFSDAGFMGSIRAFHGSPHSFEKFDVGKIGTGEGAQAYGHGLYMAENPEVAAQYKKPGYQQPGLTDAQYRAMDVLQQNGGDRAKAIAQIEGSIEYLRDAGPNIHGYPRLSPNELEDALKLLQEGFEPPRGHTYEVNINADPEHFLDWDKPLSEQHPKVQPLLAEAVKKEAYNRALAATSKARADELWSMVKDPSQAPAGFAQELLRKPEFVAQLREAGIPGIRYLDQGSGGIRTPAEAKRMLVDARADLAKQPDNQQLQIAVQQLEKQAAAPGQTHNYVVFDDSLIDIIKKYGLAGLIAAGAAHFTAPADNAHGTARGGAAPADDANALAPEDWDAIVNWWRGTQHPGTYYTQPQIKGRPPRGSFTLPDDVVDHLGDGDPRVAGAVLHGMFGLAPFTDGDPRAIDADLVKEIGHGSLAASQKVLKRFVQMLRRQSRGGVTLVHDGGDNATGHGWSVARR